MSDHIMANGHAPDIAPPAPPTPKANGKSKPVADPKTAAAETQGKFMVVRDAKAAGMATGVYFNEADDAKPGEEAGEPQRKWFCSLLEPLAHSRGTDNKSWGHLIEVVDADGMRHAVTMPARMGPTVGDGIEFRRELVDRGLRIASGTKARNRLSDLVIMWKPKRKVRCTATNLDSIVAALADRGFADYAIVLEGGWTPDALSLMAWFSGLVLGPLQRINADVPIILSCTSMPKEFSDIEGIDRVSFRNRTLVGQIAARSNRLNVTYGDWASTRPRERRGGGKPIPRIDYPTADAWVIARDKDAGWDYQKSAEELIRRSGAWSGTLGVWGEEMISRTAINPNLGIDTPQKNVASRVNIHLHMQAFYGGAMPRASDFDEDYRD